MQERVYDVAGEFLEDQPAAALNGLITFANPFSGPVIPQFIFRFAAAAYGHAKGDMAYLGGQFQANSGTTGEGPQIEDCCNTIKFRFGSFMNFLGIDGTNYAIPASDTNIKVLAGVLGHPLLPPPNVGRKLLRKFTTRRVPMVATTTTEFANGLGSQPYNISIALSPREPDLGYIPGDVVPWDQPGAPNAARYALAASEKSIRVRIAGATGLVLLNKATGVEAAITASRWDFFVTAIG